MMYTRKNSIIVKIIAMLLVLTMLCPLQAFAVESRASLYLNAYGAYTYSAGWGKMQVWFEVDGNEYMDEIGALEIQLYESKDNSTWTWVKTYDYVDYDGMLGYNDHYHAGHIDYNGTLGRYYKAYVCVWAGQNGNGDTRYFWTSAKKATLFAE